LLKYRLAMGATLIAALVGVLWADEYAAGRPLPERLARWCTDGVVPPGVVIFPVMLLLTFMASRELARIMREKQILAQTGLTCAAALTGLIVSSALPIWVPGPQASAVVATAAMAVLLASLAYYSRHQNTQGVVAAAGGALLAFVYTGLMFGFVLAVRREHSAWVLLWILMVTKASDIGAFTLGKLFGRHKMIPWLSPGKTWEGLLGGVVFASATAAAGVVLLEQSGVEPSLPSVGSAAVVGIIAAFFGQAGDLIMSLFKRDAGRKDSGHSLPGFGGVLDVLDSPLLVTPLAYWWLRLAVG